ncbi:efflux RND transporter periplasmic adaptor subunit [Chelatococcus reniformis]|uniref:CzcB-like C-terminal circularly permuted SH3-like domain-containing protein n=1 Tax=Chelatococcus reniformis TaxID=1494448 RepID=A0A916XBM3_9HYPH|nr:efflux RND transporter periplasmic adaptor subunit [Chelatococcus reniformis]GGC58739.1 hypothetical protein GCM10010994_17000 [Chelatococcus reniformis]
MHVRFAAALGAAALAAALLTTGAQAHEGHDHGETPASSATPAAPRGEAASAEVELVAAVREGVLSVYLDRFATNEPITGASVAVEAPDGPVTLKPEPEGRYTVAVPWLGKQGRHDLLLTLTVDGADDVLPVTIVVPSSPEAGGVPDGAATHRSERLLPADPLLSGVALLAFALGVAATLLVRRRRAAPAVAVLALALPLAVATARAHEGDDHGEAGGAPPAAAGSDLARRQPDGSVFVPKPVQRILAIRTVVSEAESHGRTTELPGRIVPDPNASGVVQSSVGGRLSAPSGGFPRLGTAVRKGTVLAYVTPPVQRVDVSDMRQRQGELDQQIATVERRVARYRRLVGSGAVSQVQLEEATDELQGLRDRRAALDTVRQEPEPLVAPVDGVVAESTAVAGQMAAPGAVVFQVVDPARLWVEALSFDAVAGASAATARLADGRVLQLAYQGAGLADRNQSVPVQFAIRGDTSGLRIGQFVTVQVGTGGREHGLALPRASVVRSSSGQEVVYEHVTAERFAARPVRTTTLDGGRVLIEAGLSPGKRIVTQGAELLDQVR